jgi:nuclear transport factor 2 (NTF2) superfamily protein
VGRLLAAVITARGRERPSRQESCHERHDFLGRDRFLAAGTRVPSRGTFVAITFTHTKTSEAHVFGSVAVGDSGQWFGSYGNELWETDVPSPGSKQQRRRHRRNRRKSDGVSW